MLVVLVIAGLAVIACVVMVSLGHGGEMAEFPPDTPPLDLPAAAQVTSADLIALQLPIGLVGYSTQAVDETLHRVSVALGERDTRIAVLEQRVAELSYARSQPRREPRRAEMERAETERAEVGQAAAARDGDDENRAERERAEAEEAW
ncbi:hypothetical protein [Microbispora sp. H11081]|uniref:hypothetical protein n=1 Tax=Microbispora sp. H11081 TaxID=2729107 RepID=UPI00147316A1|nr:hypothetical protein [Microbispora sp. H11081]